MAQTRPTDQISDVILDSMDFAFTRLTDRLDGITDEEYLWEPAEGMWSVRVGGDGVPRVEGAGRREIQPAPVTTIAWRLWHLTFDCFDAYTRRFDGDQDQATPVWTVEADEAVDVLRVKWAGFRRCLTDRDFWDQLGPNWGHFSRHSVADIAMHAGNELNHHGAEIGLLRDLHRVAT